MCKINYTVKEIPRKIKPRENGFTLIEVLVAVAVLAIITGVFTMLFTNSYKSIFASGNKSNAQYIAQQELERRIAANNLENQELSIPFGSKTIKIAGYLKTETQQYQGVGSSQQVVTIYSFIPSDLKIVATQPPRGVVGEWYQFNFSATGGIPEYTFSVTAGELPPGLALHPDGTLSGKPAGDGLYTFVVTVTDSAGGIRATSACEFSIAISPAPAH